MFRHGLPALLIVLALALPTHADTGIPPKEVTNTLGMKFVWIPPGKFQMGTPTAQRVGMYRGEVQHDVTLSKGFYLGAYAVTQKQWQAVMGGNPSRFHGENLPVERVSWNDCQAFLKRLRERDHRNYRLPTEAQWEYACRAGATTQYSFGDKITPQQANYFDDLYYASNPGKPLEKTTPVGTFPPNGFGLYDMHGNVAQWCQDWYGKLTDQAVVDPQGPAQGEERIYRGGCWADNPVCCRCAWRARDRPGTPGDGTGLRACFLIDN